MDYIVLEKAVNIIKGASSGEFFFFTILLLVLLTIFMLFLFSSFSLFLLIIKTPVTGIGLSQPGVVALFGKVRAAQKPHLISPITQNPCCYYKYVIYDEGLFKKHSNALLKGESSNFFTLEDGTGTCLVIPFAADLTPEVTEIECRKLPPHLLDDPIITAHPGFKDLVAAASRPLAKLKMREEYIKLNQDIFIVGSYSQHRYTDKDIFGTTSSFFLKFVTEELNQKWNAYLYQEKRLTKINLIAELPVSFFIKGNFLISTQSREKTLWKYFIRSSWLLLFTLIISAIIIFFILARYFLSY